MKIILENVIKGITVTGVAKIQNDKGEVVNNVPFNVRTTEELNLFVNNLLTIQSDFSAVSDGEFTVKPIVEKEKDLVQEALNAVYEGEGKLKAKIIDQTEYDALVSNYKNLVNSKKDNK